MRIPDFGLPAEDLRPTGRAVQAGPAEGTRPRRAIAAVGRLAGLLLLATVLGAQGVHAQTDTIPPTPSPRFPATSGRVLLSFSENLTEAADSLPPISAFVVTANGVSLPVSRVAVDPNGRGDLESLAVFLTGNPIRRGETIVVTYTDPSADNDARAIQDAAGNDAASFTTGQIDNISTQVTEPFPPTILTATAAGETAIDLAWEAPARDGGSAVTGYRIERSDDDGSSWTDVEDDTESTATTYRDTGLASVATYLYRVSAINPEGRGEPSGTAEATTDDTTPPTLVRALAVRNLVSLLFSEDLIVTAASRPPTSAFEVTANGVRLGVDRVNREAGDSVRLTLVLTSDVLRGETVVMTYTDPSAGDDARAIQDAAGNDAASFTTGQGGTPGIRNNSTTVTEPFPPTNLTAAGDGGTGIALAWEAPARTGGRAISGYRIERSDDDGSSWTELEADTDTTATTYEDTGLMADTTYVYRVSAINSEGTGQPSATAEATPGVDTAPPTLVWAGAIENVIELDFSEPLERPAIENALELDFSALLDTLETLSPPISAFVVTANGVRLPISRVVVDPLAAGATSQFEVYLTGNPIRRGETIVVTYTDPSADNDSLAIQDLAGNDVASFTTGQDGLPGVSNQSMQVTEPFPPTGLTATVAGETTIDLAWTPPARNGGSAITKHQYREKEGSGTYGGWTDVPNSAPGEANANGYTVENRAAGTTYTYQVRAVNAEGESDASNEAGATTPGVPTEPTNLNALGRERSVALWWTTPDDDGGSPITRYQYREKEGSGDYGGWTDIPGSAPGEANANSYTISGRTAGTNYTYQVRAVNAVGGSDASNEASATPTAMPPPTLETGAFVSNVDQSDHGNDAEAGRDATWAQGFRTGPKVGYELTSIELDVGGTLPPSGELTVSLRAETSSGYPADDDLVTFVNPDLSGAGRKKWTLPADMPFYRLSGGTTYFVVVTADDTFEWRVTGSKNEDSGAVGGWQILDEAYGSEPAVNPPVWLTDNDHPVLQIRVNGVSEPSPPTGLTATADGETTIDLAWNAPAQDGGRAISGYRIERSADAGTSWTDVEDDTESTATTYRDTGLVSGATYRYRVSAINSQATGEPSGTAEATTEAIPPTLVSAEAARLWVLLRFSEDLTLAADSLPPTSAFEVTANGVSLPEFQVAVDPDLWGSFVIAVVFRNPILQGETIVVTYTDPSADNDARAIQDVAGNDAASFTTGQGGIPGVTNSSTHVTVPFPPTGLTAVGAGETGIDVAWNAPARTGGTAISGYRIERSADAGATWTEVEEDTESTETAYRDTGLVEGPTYRYRVSAINLQGTGDPSGTAEATTVANPPTLVETLARPGDIVLVFSEDLDSALASRPQISAFVVTANGVPLPVSGVVGDASASGDSDVLRVELTGNLIRKGETIVVTYTDPSADNDARAIQDAAGNDAASFTTGRGGNPSVENGSPHVTVPFPTTGLTAAIAGTVIDLAWDAPARDGGSAITKHRYREKEGSGTYGGWTDIPSSAPGEANEAGYTFTGRTVGTTYTYQVRAVNAEGEGDASNEASATPTAAETTPPTLIGADAEPGDVVLWFSEELTTRAAEQPETSAFEVTADGVSLPVSRVVLDPFDTGESYQVALMMTGTPFRPGESIVVTYTDPSAGNDFRALQDLAGNDAESFTTGEDGTPAVENYAKGVTAPFPPTGLTASADGERRIDLAWDAPRDGGRPITGYRIERSDDAGAGWTEVEDDTESTETTYEDTGLTSGTTYRYRVSAINSEGAGQPSGTAEATTDDTTAPTFESAEIVGDELVITFSEALDEAMTPAAGAFTVEAAGTEVTVGTVTVSGATVTLELDEAVAMADTVTVAYTKPASGDVLQDPRANPVATFPAQMVTNEPPTLVSAVATRGGITLVFSEDLETADFFPSGSAFEVTANGVTLGLPSPTSLPDRRHLLLSMHGNPIRRGDSIVVTYTDASAGDDLFAIQDEDGNDVATFTTGQDGTPAVENRSTQVTVPFAPTGLTAAADGDSRIDLAWDPPARNGGQRIRGYRIERSADDGASWTDVVEDTDTTATTYEDARLTAGRTYRYRVSAINSQGTGEPSGTAEATTDPDDTTPPTLVFAGAIENVVELDFSEPLERPVIENALELDFSALLDTLETLSPPISAFEVTANGVRLPISRVVVDPLAAGATSQFEVYLTGNPIRRGETIVVTYTDPSADNDSLAIQDLAGNDAASFTTGQDGLPGVVNESMQAPVPFPPTGLTARAAGETTIDLAWTAPARDGGSAITKYQYREKEGSGSYGGWTDIPSSAAGEANANGYTVENRTLGTTYTYQVRAVNAEGESGASNEAVATPTTATEPPAPTKLRAANREESVRLSWTTPGDGGSPITKHRYREKAGSGSYGVWTDIPGSAAGEANANGYTVENRTVGTTYTYQVRAVNAVGESDASGEAHGTPTIEPPAPTKLRAAAGEVSVILRWSTPGHGSSRITRHRYREKAGSGTYGGWTDIPYSGAEQANANSYTVPGRTAGTTYTYQVRAVNAVGASDASGEANATPVAAGTPPAPTLFATGRVESVAMSWTTRGDGGSPITKHRYREKAGSGSYGAWTDIPGSGAGEANANSYTVPSRTAGTRYTYQVRAVNARGVGVASNEASATPTATATPPPATDAFVGNVGQSDAAASVEADNSTFLAQGFRTGPKPGGYEMTSIELDIDAFTGLSANLTVSLRAKARGGDYPADDDLVIFVNPAGLSGAGRKEWTLPIGMTSYRLSRNTTYFVVAKGARGRASLEWWYTGSTDEDEGAVGGWRILDGSVVRDLTEADPDAWVAHTDALQIRVNGTNIPGTDAILTGLELSAGGKRLMLQPQFSPTVTNYEFTVPNHVLLITVTATRRDDNAAIVYRSLCCIRTDLVPETPALETRLLRPIRNVLTVIVTAEDGHNTKTYRLIILRESGPQTGLLRRNHLASNLNQFLGSNTIGRTQAWTSAQAFTTGSHAHGYTLSAVVVCQGGVHGSSEDKNPDVELWSANEDGTPGSRMAQLTWASWATVYDLDPEKYGVRAPSVFGTNLFRAPDGVVLDPNTTYFVVVKTAANFPRRGVRLLTTDSDYEDTSGTSPNWSLADHRHARTRNGTTWTTDTNVLGITVRGSANAKANAPSAPGDPPTATVVSSPERHDGENRFSVRIDFSEPLEVAASTLRDHAFTAEGGDVTAVRQVDGSDRSKWEIEVEPAGADSVTLTLSASPECAHVHSLCTSDGRRLEQGLELTVPGPPQLTARIEDVPSEHDGSSPFGIIVSFSEAIQNSDTLVHKAASATTGGTVTSSVRYANRSDIWRFLVAPDGNGPVTFVLTGGGACAGSASAVLCAEDGKVLSNDVSATVRGPAAISVADAEANGETGMAVEFTVSLSRPALGPVTVDYATGDGTATAGEDYTAASGTLTFSIKEQTKTVSVPVLHDDDPGDDEAFTLTLSNPTNGYIEDGTATGTIYHSVFAGISVAGAEADESEGAVRFAVSLSRPALEPVTVDYATSDSTAAAGDDYEATSGTLAFSVEERTKTVAVKILDDGNPEEEKMFTLTLSNATNGYIEDGTATGTIRDDDADAVPLTASFEDMPPIHTGDSFRFKLIFSEELNVSYKTLEDDAFDVTGGELNGASRLNEGSNRRWRITIKPDSESDTVTITLPETTNCRADGAICTRDKRPLSNSLSATVAAVDESVPVVSVADAFASEGDTVAFTVSLSKASDRQVTVAYATSDGTATAGDDFTAASGTLAFAANETSKTLGVATAADSVDEGNETFTLTLSSPANAALGDAAATGTISDAADAAPLTASFVDMPSDHVGTRAFAFKLIFSAKPEVTYKMLEDDAFDVTGGEVRAASRLQQGSDLGWEIRIQPDSKFSTVTVTLPETTDCNAVEAICTKDGRPLSNSPSATVIGQEGNWGASRLDVSDASAAEGDAVEFTVSLTRMSNHEVTVSYATSGGTAAAGDDFTAASGTLAFTANETSKTVSVATTDDSADEEDETFTLTLSSPTYTTLGDSTATGTIEDDDDAAALTATFANMPSTHTGDSFTFGLVFSEEFEVSYKTLEDDAFDITGGTVAGASRQEQGSDRRWTITVEPASANGAVTVTLPETTDCNADGAICTEDGRPLSNSPSATVEGADEATSVPAVSVTDASATEGNSVAFTVSLSEASDEQVTVDYATSGGTAAAGDDFTEASGTLAFGANETSKTVSVATTDDSDDEEDETFTLTLSSPVNATLGDAAATGTIEDDDDAPPLTATLKEAPPEHDGSKFEIVISFSEEIQNSYTHVHQAASATTGGTLTSSARHQGRKDMWKFRVQPDGNGPVTFILSGGGTCAGSKSAVLCTRDGRVLSNAVSATVSGPAAISVADAEATEGTDAAASFTVSLSRPAIGPVTVDYATGDGTATAGEDYTAASGTLTFSIREQTKTVSVPVLDDAGAEDGETFTLTLSNASNGYIEDGTATGTIHDDDDEAASVPAVSVADASATEGDPVAFTVSLSAASDEQVTVAYATSGGTAASGTDFTASSGTLAFGANETSKTVSVETTDDSDDEEDETFTLTLSSPANATLGDAAATGTIEDDDDAPPPLTARFANMPSSHAGDPFTFGLVFSEEPDDLSYRTLRDDAFDVTGGSVAGASRQEQGSDRRWTITVEPASATSTMTITLPETTNCNADGAICTEDDRPLSNSPSATVEGEDEVVPVVSVADASAAEGDPVAFTVSLSEASDEQVTVAYATSGGTAAAGDDFTAESGTLAFGANETSKTVSVATTDDSDDEEDETFTLTLSSPANATLGDAAATGTIEDDDDAAPPLTARFADMPSTHTGNSFTFALVFSEEFRISYKTLRDDAFEVTGGSVTGAGRQEQGSNRRWTITVEPASANDTVTVTLPETTDCGAGGAICTDDDRPLSHSLSATVIDAASASSTAGDAAGGVVEDDGLNDALAVLAGLTQDEARTALLGEKTLSEARLAALDRLGNRNGRYDLGDMLSWIERCRRGEADCGTTSDSVPPASAALLAVAAAGPGRRRRKRPRRRRRPARMAARPLALLLAATAWSCTGDLVGPPAGDAAARTGAVAAPSAALSGPGLLTVEWTAPAGRRDIGVLLELEGPGIASVQAPGLDLYRSGEPARLRIIVAGSIREGPLVRFRVPDRAELPLYRVRVIEVTGEDFGLRDLSDYRAVIAVHRLPSRRWPVESVSQLVKEYPR